MCCVVRIICLRGHLISCDCLSCASSWSMSVQKMFMVANHMYVCLITSFSLKLNQTLIIKSPNVLIFIQDLFSTFDKYWLFFIFSGFWSYSLTRFCLECIHYKSLFAKSQFISFCDLSYWFIHFVFSKVC